MNQGNWLEIKNLDVYYDQKQVINQLNLKLKLLETTAIIGQNGSGKSTLIKIITKLKYPNFNKNSFIRLFGSTSINIWELRSKIGFVLSEIDSRIKNKMTVKDVILSAYNGTIGLVNYRSIYKEYLIELGYIMVLSLTESFVSIRV